MYLNVCMIVTVDL